LTAIVTVSGCAVVILDADGVTVTVGVTICEVSDVVAEVLAP
jgi:hypothetical protein